LQERSLVNRAIEETLEANVPEEVRAVFFREEVLAEVASEVS
jgi:hypothetical protein